MTTRARVGTAGVVMIGTALHSWIGWELAALWYGTAALLWALFS